jgi:protein TonB
VIALSAQDRRDLVRWLACGAVVVFAHAGVAAALIEWREPVEEEGLIGMDVTMVEPQPEPPQIDPTPVPVEKVEEKEEPLPVQQSEAMLPPKPEEQPEPPREEVPAPLPRPVQARAEATWKNQILTILQHNKRYPPEARARDEHGVTRLGFSIDSQGRLLSSRIVASSGSAAIDAETLALVQRSQPFPPPPPDLAGSEQIVGFDYHFR